METCARSYKNPWQWVKVFELEKRALHDDDPITPKAKVALTRMLLHFTQLKSITWPMDGDPSLLCIAMHISVSTLHSLTMSVSEEAIYALDHLSDLSNLQVLTIIPDPEIFPLTITPWTLKSLTTLRMEACSDDMSATVTFLARCSLPALKTLEFSDPVPEDESVTGLVRLLHQHDSLEKLNLPLNSVHYEAVVPEAKAKSFSVHPASVDILPFLSKTVIALRLGYIPSVDDDRPNNATEILQILKDLASARPHTAIQCVQIYWDDGWSGGPLTWTTPVVTSEAPQSCDIAILIAGALRHAISLAGAGIKLVDESGMTIEECFTRSRG
jgi:hypothetical protein